MKHFPLSKPDITIQDIRAIVRVLKSGMLSLGPELDAFEQSFAKKIGTRYACAVSSGTAGLHLALLGAKIKSGDEVITTPFSFVASANSIQYVGAKPVFVDIDPETYNLNPAGIEKAISRKTKAILVVHIFGQPADMDPILAIAKKHNLAIIEDACESILATYKGRQVGTFGQSAVFAFYPNKQMTTGEGGMLVTNHEPLYRLYRSLRNQGRSDNRNWLDHVRLGYNYRMDEMSAALGRSQLLRLNSLVARRAAIARRYSRLLAKYPGLVQIPLIASEVTHTWFAYTIRLRRANPTRDTVIKRLEEAGVAAKPYLPSIHLMDFYRNQYGYKPGDLPISESVSRSILALPLYPELNNQKVDEIVNRLIKVLI